MPTPLTNGIYRFGVYEVDLSSGELRKSGIKLRLSDQAFRVLVLMLARPSEIVTREELRIRLWPEGTFVDFDHGLNTVVNKLRETLGDSAANSRFIETLARRGYRFIAPVEFVSGVGAARNTPDPQPPATASDSGELSSLSSTALLTSATEVPAVNRSYVRLWFLLLQIMYLIFYATALARLGLIQDLFDQFPSSRLMTTVLVISASVGIPIRLFLISSVAFGLAGLTAKFSRLFVPILVLDALWSIAPFLLAPQIGMGLAMASTAALVYSPFAQRALLLMADRARS